MLGGVHLFAALTVLVSRDDASRSCPDTRDVLEALARTGSTSFAEGSSEASVEVKISREGERYRATIRTRRGERVLVDDDGDCRGLREALPTVLSMMMKGDDEKANPAPPTKMRDEPRPAEAPRKDRLGSLGLGAGGHAGLTRDLGLLLSVDGTLMLGRFVAGTTRLHFAPPSSLVLGRGRIDVGWVGGEIGACGRLLERPAFALLPCVGAFGGASFAKGSGFEQNSSATRAIFGASLGLRAEIIRPIGVYLQPSLLLPFETQAYSVDGVGTAYDPWPVGLLFTAGALLSDARSR